MLWSFCELLYDLTQLRNQMFVRVDDRLLIFVIDPLLSASFAHKIIVMAHDQDIINRFRNVADFSWKRA